MKKFSIIAIIIGALLIISGIVTPWISLLLMPPAPSVGIIGGADGPTAILTYSLWAGSIYGKLAFWGVVALIVGVVLLIISKFKKK